MQRESNFLIQKLEPRVLMAVHFVVNTTQDVHAISRYIYGTNQALSGNLAGGTFERLGGNRWTAYNWENNASNAGSDYQYQNDGYLDASNSPGHAVAGTLADAAAHNAGVLLTIPMNGYVSADKSPGGDVRNSGSNYLQTRFKVEQPRKGSAFTLTPDTSDGYVYEDEFVNWVNHTYASQLSNPNTPIWYSLDNEPDLWASTHAEVHPAAPTYAEMVQKTTAYASAIKDVSPNALVFGPVNYGWNGYTTLQDAPDANGRDFQSYYLAQMNAASTAAGKRLLDVMDVHWYPEATGGGVRITTGDGTTPAVVAARLQAPRSLWDSTYTETSWITQYSTGGPINLIPRLNTKIAQNYPGTKLAITEYNYGGGATISGGIAQADVLGIFGKQNLFAANEWPLASNESFIDGAFAMFRNYDGAGSTFGDTSISATTDDVTNSSVYASTSSGDPSTLTLVVINKSASAQTANLNLGNISINGSAKLYQLTSANASPTSAGTLSIADPKNFNYTMPGYSVTTIRIPLLTTPPQVTGSSFNYAAHPSTIAFTFSKDVSASLSSADLTVLNIANNSSVLASYTSFDSLTNTATFTLPDSLANGSYTATLLASGVTDSAGQHLVANANLGFFSLQGDINRDGKVDIVDLGILSTDWQKSGMNWGQGDLNGDGTVDIVDLGILSTNWQQTVPSINGAVRPTKPTPTKVVFAY